MDRLMPFDELNIFGDTVRLIFERDGENKRQYIDYLLDDIEDILIMSYIFGNEAANTMLGTDFKPDEAEVTASVNREVAGKTWRERVTEYLEAEYEEVPVLEEGEVAGKTVAQKTATRRITAEDIVRVVETDSHRVYNEAIFEVAVKAQAQGIVVYKRWETMLDDKVRDTHYYLQGEQVPLSEEFHTYDGDYSMRPGDFQFPENNVNCRCRLVLTRA